MIELPAAHHVTVGWTGRPGERTFLVQLEDEHVRVTLLAEKGQVAGIAELLEQLLARVDDAPATDWDRDAMALREPVEPDWRVGEISAGLDAEGQRFMLELIEVGEPDEPREEVRAFFDRDQARRLAAHATEQVEQGRPPCPLCSRPIEADGSHVCPSTNGHGRLTR
ncbi:MAG: DUF3090 family protein [Nitriliruptoraceae bacterium]